MQGSAVPSGWNASIRGCDCSTADSESKTLRHEVSTEAKQVMLSKWEDEWLMRRHGKATMTLGVLSRPLLCFASRIAVRLLAFYEGSGARVGHM